MSTSIYASRSPEYYAPYIDRFKPLNPPLLELGAGHGLLLTLATQRGIECCGVEVDPRRVADCKSKNLNVLEHDLGKPLPFADNSFGMIYCGQVIEHMPSQSQKVMLNEAYRVLKVDGQFQICSPNRNHEASRLVEDHKYLLTMAELKEMLEAAGFKDINMAFNYVQKVPEIPPDILQKIWKEFRPDLLSETANAICKK